VVNGHLPSFLDTAQLTHSVIKELCLSLNMEYAELKQVSNMAWVQLLTVPNNV